MKLSIIVVSFNPPETLARCLEALLSQADAQTEILVVRHGLDASIKQRFPQARWIDTPENLNIPQMRTLGIRSSQSDYVSLLEDDCLVSDSWLSVQMESSQSGAVAVGGPIEPGDFRGGLNWAVFYCDYGRFTSPFSGEVDALPGNNTTYWRQAIAGFLDDPNGFYEVFVNQQLQAKGQTLTANSRLAVRNMHQWVAADAISVPLHHGRGFAALRVARRPLPMRLIYALASVIIPPLQTIRTIQRVRAKGRSDSHLLSALPWIVLYYSCWAFGEFLGYLFGAGSSAAKWQG